MKANEDADDSSCCSSVNSSRSVDSDAEVKDGEDKVAEEEDDNEERDEAVEREEDGEDASNGDADEEEDDEDKESEASSRGCEDCNGMGVDEIMGFGSPASMVLDLSKRHLRTRTHSRFFFQYLLLLGPHVLHFLLFRMITGSVSLVSTRLPFERIHVTLSCPTSTNVAPSPTKTRSTLSYYRGT